ncbi:UNVERIFIED_CONTAM: hypothetical protein NCL1_45532 [Trichonephila clavipes]
MNLRSVNSLRFCSDCKSTSKKALHQQKKKQIDNLDLKACVIPWQITEKRSIYSRKENHNRSSEKGKTFKAIAKTI